MQRYAAPVGRAAMIWAIISAFPRLYWEFGGRAGIHTLSQQWQDVYADAPNAVIPEFNMLSIAMLYGLVALVVLIALKPWGQVLAHPLQVAALWIIAGFLLFYGTFGWLSALLMVTGVIAIPDTIGEEPARWMLLMWEPWQVLGGILVAATAYACQKGWLEGSP